MILSPKRSQKTNVSVWHGTGIQLFSGILPQMSHAETPLSKAERKININFVVSITNLSLCLMLIFRRGLDFWSSWAEVFCYKWEYPWEAGLLSLKILNFLGRQLSKSLSNKCAQGSLIVVGKCMKTLWRLGRSRDWVPLSIHNAYHDSELWLM